MSNQFIDISQLNPIMKDYPKESQILKNIYQLINDFKSTQNNLKTHFENEIKEAESVSKGNMLQSKQFNTELISQNLVNEEFSNILNIIQYYLLTDEKISSQAYDEYNKTFSNINNIEYESFNTNINEMVQLFKEHYILKNRFKQLTLKIDKISKEIEALIMERRKENEKNTYNITNKIRIDEKINRLIGEYLESTSSYNLLFNEIKSSEDELNAYLSRIIYYISNDSIGLYNRIFMIISFILNGKIRLFTNQIKLLKENHSLITKLELLSIDEIIKIHIQVKSIKHYDIEQINFDNQYNIKNFYSSYIYEIIQNYMNIYLSVILNKRKILGQFQKAIKEKGKILENYVNQMIKYNQKLSMKIVPFQNKKIQSTFDIFRSINEMLLKKQVDFNKNFNLIYSVIENQIKELSIEEGYFSIYNRLVKESNSIKDSIFKNHSSIDRITYSISLLIEEIKKTEDAKEIKSLEAKLNSLKNDENSLLNEKEALFKKGVKFLTEGLETVKGITKKGYDILINRNIEMKETLLNVIQSAYKLNQEIKDYIEVFMLQMKQEHGNNDDAMYSKRFIQKEFLNIEYLEKINKEESQVNIMNDYINSLFESEYKHISINFLDEILSKKEYIIGSLLTNEEFEEISSYGVNNISTVNIANNVNVSNLNLNILSKYDGIFYIDNEETVINYYNCGLSDKIILQGKLYLTSKKLVFHSWFNENSLFGKTHIEIPNEDIIDISKKKNTFFDNSIYIQTQAKWFVFTSFINRNECYVCLQNLLSLGKDENEGEVSNISIDNSPHIKEIHSSRKVSCMNEDYLKITPIKMNKKSMEIRRNSEKSKKSTITIKSKRSTKSMKSKQSKYNLLKITNENEKKTKNQLDSFKEYEEERKEQEDMKIRNDNDNNISINDKIIHNKIYHIDNNICDNILDQDNNERRNNNKIVNKFYNTNTLSEIITKYDIFNRINKYTSNKIKEFYSNYQHKIYENIITKHKLPKIPLSYIYEYLYNPYKVNHSLKFNENFMKSFKLHVNDKNLEENIVGNLNLIPSFYLNKKDIPFSSKESSTLISFINQLEQGGEYINSEYNVLYTSNHPIPNPKFMGPKNLDVKEEIKVYFISPTCMIADHYIYLSGFMMMDLFYIVKSFKYESELKLDSYNNKEIIEYESYLSVDFIINFVKETFFKEKIIKESFTSNKEDILNSIIPYIIKGLNDADNDYIKHREERIIIDNNLEEVNNCIDYENSICNEKENEMNEENINMTHMKSISISTKNIDFDNKRGKSLIKERKESFDILSEKKKEGKPKYDSDSLQNDKRMMIEKEDIQKIRKYFYIIYIVICFMFILYGDSVRFGNFLLMFIMLMLIWK